MAEFQEVMRQWRRMCELHTCDNRDESELPLCPLIIKHNGYPCDDAVTDLSQESVGQIEQIVTAWAAEHPEPVYPSWLEYIMDVQHDCVAAYNGGNDTLWKWMWTTPIPADIAEKLGVEPKEGL